jgi:hypothetical protein
MDSDTRFRSQRDLEALGLADKPRRAPTANRYVRAMPATEPQAREMQALPEPRRTGISATGARYTTAHPAALPGNTLSRFAEMHDQFRTALQDNRLPVTRLYEKVMARSGISEIPDGMDFVEKSRFHASLLAERANKIDKEFLSPMLEDLQRSGMSIEDLHRYSTAVHAPFFNQMISKRRNADMPMDELAAVLQADGLVGDEVDADFLQTLFSGVEDGWAGKGLSDAGAARIVQEYQGKPGAPALQDAHKRLMEMNKSSLERRVSGGLMSRSEADTLLQMSPFYVPLHVAKSDEAAGFSAGVGKNIGAREFKRALGHFGTENVDALSQSLMQAYEAEDRALENEARQSLMRFLEAHPHPEMYEVTSKAPLERIAYNDKETGEVKSMMVPRRDYGMKPEDPVVIVKVNGKKRYLAFRGNQSRVVAHAVRGDLMVRNKWLSFINRYVNTPFKMMRTALSPEFMLTNPQVDFVDAMVNLSADDLGKVRDGTLRHLPAAWRALAAYDRGRGGFTNTNAGHNLREAVKNGLMFESKFYGDIDRMYEDVAKKFEKVSGRKASLSDWVRPVEDADGKGLPWLLAQMDRANGIGEMGTRLSIYMSARENGMPVTQSVELARNVTVDFHRKGNYTPLLNTLYVFSNVGIQASYRMGGAMVKSKRGRQMAVGLVAAGFINGFLNSVMQGGDDDEPDEYGKVDEWFKAGGAIWRDPVSGKWLRVRMRGIPAALWYLGVKLADVMNGRAAAMEAASETALKFLGDVFNPLGSSGSSLQLFSPTLTDPVVQLGENKDWTGRKIVPDSPFEKHKPMSQRAYKTTPEAYKRFSEAINAATGGDSVTSGKADISPEVWDHWVEFFGGSTLRFVTRSLSTAAKAASGEDVETSEIPFVRSFAYDTDDESRQNGRYYAARQQFDKDVYRFGEASSDEQKIKIASQAPYVRYQRAKDISELIDEIDIVRKTERETKSEYRRNKLRLRRMELQENVIRLLSESSQ